MATSSSPNYAQELGIHNKWAPIVFAVIYFILFVYYIAQAIRRHATIYGGLAFFAATRVIAYSLRAALANISSDAHNRSIAIAYTVFFSISFFGLLLSAYNLLRNRNRLARVVQTGKRTGDFFYRSHIVDVLLALAVILGTVGVIFAVGNYGGHSRVGRGLFSTSTYIFLAVSLAILILTILLVLLERKLRHNNTHNTLNSNSNNTGNNTTGTPPIGSMGHHAVLFIIATLLLLRTLYYAVTVHDRFNGATTKQSAAYNEHLWYPLAALAELLIAMLFLVPGLVPLRSLVHGTHRNGQYNDNEKVGRNNATSNGYNSTGPTAGAGYAGTTGATTAADGIHNSGAIV